MILLDHLLRCVLLPQVHLHRIEVFVFVVRDIARSLAFSASLVRVRPCVVLGHIPLLVITLPG
jgi:hypothetical protein